MAAITDLASASSAGASDYLVISQSGTDKKITADKFARLAAAQTFADVQTMTAGIGVGVADGKLFRPTAGVIQQKLELVTLAASAALVVRSDSAWALVHVFNATQGKMAMYAIEGNGNSRLVHGDTGYFSTSSNSYIRCFALSGVVYVQNFYGTSQIVGCVVWA